MTTIVIPAHNEAQVIGRLLRQLGPDAELQVIVAANGCTDDTAEIAASFGQHVRVLDLPVASKHAALVAASRLVTSLPCMYVDADVEIGRQDIRELAAALDEPGVLAVAPERTLILSGRRWPVRWFYDVWIRLPEAQHGLWGRGVIAVGATGQQRIAGLPPLMGDDLAASLLFTPGERCVVTAAHVVVHPPRTLSDLLRRRIRTATGVAQIEREPGAPASTARTRPGDLARIAGADWRMAPRVLFFLAIAVAARLRARPAVARGDYTTWLRDESSRQPQAR